jgi:hypothetical protein
MLLVSSFKNGENNKRRNFKDEVKFQLKSTDSSSSLVIEGLKNVREERKVTDEARGDISK